MHRLLWILVLAGCPPPPRYIRTDVTAARAPVAGALVAATCTTARDPAHRYPAKRTDDAGRARVPVYAADQGCTLLVAKPGYATVETGPVDVCPGHACPPVQVELGVARAAAPPGITHAETPHADRSRSTDRPRPLQRAVAPAKQMHEDAARSIGPRPLEVAQ